jgi:hypothetical protein
MSSITFITYFISDQKLINSLSQRINKNVPPKYQNLFKTDTSFGTSLVIAFRDLAEEENVGFYSSFILSLGFFIRKNLKEQHKDVKVYFSGAHGLEAACLLVPTGPWDYNFENNKDTEKFSKLLKQAGKITADIQALNAKVA